MPGDAREVEVRAGETTSLDLAAKRRGSIDVAITDFETKAPVPNISCRAVMAVNGMQGLMNWDLAVLPKTDATGRLRLDPAPAGKVIVACASPEGRRSGPSGELVVAPGANARIALESVRTTNETWGSAGLGFDWRVVAPRIVTIEPKGAAAAAGLTRGDVVISVDDRPVGTLDGAGVSYLIQDHPIGATFPITVRRGAQTLRVTLEMRPGN